ncbi:hypothetical protein PYCCODRAFT_1412865 [Trametes coccinea BRFM310]|uniref:HMG box domain-containing protein n=1 Tax=Trametes coccinea (strain BRFM310) TaxID=1353009 RepID=A0A1Y2IJJ6_TRAC3|nr:hypothetical protein PYCCODRAFT_1412865 [Trametes coccinea BRFM310]
MPQLGQCGTTDTLLLRLSVSKRHTIKTSRKHAMAPMTPPSRPVEQPPRPPNAWMLYRAEKSKEFTEGRPEGVGLPQSQISKILGQRWTQEPKAVRDIYERKAAEAKREHDRMYPGYKYTPIPKAERQKRRAEAKAAKERARAEAKMAKASGRKSGRTSPQRGSETGSVGVGHAIPVPPDFLRVPHDPSAVPYPSAITQYPVTLFRPSLNATSYLSWSTKQWMARSMQQQGVASARSDGGSVSNDRLLIAVSGSDLFVIWLMC